MSLQWSSKETHSPIVSLLHTHPTNSISLFSLCLSFVCFKVHTQYTLPLYHPPLTSFSFLSTVFHNSEDFFNTFLSLAILRWPIRSLQIVLTDIFPEGPFFPMWSKVFKGTNPPIMAHDMAKLYGNKNVCYKKLVFAILGAAAPITVYKIYTEALTSHLCISSKHFTIPCTFPIYIVCVFLLNWFTTNPISPRLCLSIEKVASWDTDCHNVALVRAYSDYVVRKLNLHRENIGRGAKDVNITYTARRASVEWPEKAFCDTENSFFDCAQLGHLKIRKLGRMIKNDKVWQCERESYFGSFKYFLNNSKIKCQCVVFEKYSFVPHYFNKMSYIFFFHSIFTLSLLSVLKDILPALKHLESVTFSNGARVNVREVDFSVLSLEDQIKIDVTTDIMIGPHGAGLMHNIFMPTRAALMELFVDGYAASVYTYIACTYDSSSHINSHFPLLYFLFLLPLLSLTL